MTSRKTRRAKRRRRRLREIKARSECQLPSVSFPDFEPIKLVPAALPLPMATELPNARGTTQSLKAASTAQRPDSLIRIQNAVSDAAALAIFRENFGTRCQATLESCIRAIRSPILKPSVADELTALYDEATSNKASQWRAGEERGFDRKGSGPCMMSMTKVEQASRHFIDADGLMPFMFVALQELHEQVDEERSAGRLFRILMKVFRVQYSVNSFKEVARKCKGLPMSMAEAVYDHIRKLHVHLFVQSSFRAVDPRSSTRTYTPIPSPRSLSSANWKSPERLQRLIEERLRGPLRKVLIAEATAEMSDTSAEMSDTPDVETSADDNEACIRAVTILSQAGVDTFLERADRKAAPDDDYEEYMRQEDEHGQGIVHRTLMAEREYARQLTYDMIKTVLLSQLPAGPERNTIEESSTRIDQALVDVESVAVRMEFSFVKLEVIWSLDFVMSDPFVGRKMSILDVYPEGAQSVAWQHIERAHRIYTLSRYLLGSKAKDTRNGSGSRDSQASPSSTADLTSSEAIADKVGALAVELHKSVSSLLADMTSRLDPLIKKVERAIKGSQAQTDPEEIKLLLTEVDFLYLAMSENRFIKKLGLEFYNAEDFDSLEDFLDQIRAARETLTAFRDDKLNKKISRTTSGSLRK